jgi:hypothetical protein
MNCHKGITIVESLIEIGQMANLAMSVGWHWLLRQKSI